MASYDAWNRAIAAYFLAGAAKGSPIFLSVDDDAIEDVKLSFVDEPVAEEAVSDFREAIRTRCVFRNTVGIDWLRGMRGDVPGGIAFLALMVYAANQMQEESGINDTDYFRRLRFELGLSDEGGRPQGLRIPQGGVAPEEPLWLEWNEYLLDAGFQPTAERGEGPQTYLRYVITQAILRESDKQYLRQRFHDAHLSLQFDCDQLGFWLKRQQITRRHLAEGLRHPDLGRQWEFYRAAHRVYEMGDWVTTGIRTLGIAHSLTRSIECGLYRTEDLTGMVRYWIFPKQPTRIRAASLSVELPGSASPRPLRLLRAGFFAPLWASDPFVDQAVEWRVHGDPCVQKLLFPGRDFWVLVHDPENPQGAWASWKPYLELGEQWLLLCRSGAFDAEMERFRAAKLVEWTERVEHAEWVEYHGGMVLSYDWGGFISDPDCRALADALTPRAMAGISLSGGLRDPNQNAWLEGFAPLLRVYGFEREFEIVVTSSRGAEVFRQDVARQIDALLPGDLEPDSYQIEAKRSGTRVAMRAFRIVSWDVLQEHPDPEEIVNCSPASTAGIRMRGVLLCDACSDIEEVGDA